MNNVCETDLQSEEAFVTTHLNVLFTSKNQTLSGGITTPSVDEWAR